MKTITLNVKGMSCGHCVNSVEGAMKTIGVDGKVDLSKGTVALVYDESKITIETIKETIEEQGYDVL